MGEWGRIWLLGLLLATPPALAEPAQAGRAETVRGEVAVQGGEQRRELHRGDPFFVGERLATGHKGLAVLRFLDDTRFVLGRDSVLEVRSFSMARAGEGMVVEVAKGVFRFISGAVARRRPEAMEVKVGRLASIGVRGTRVAGEIGEGRARVLLLPPERPGHASAIEVSNDFGRVVIDTPGWGTVIPDAHSPPGPPRRMRLRTVEHLMRSLGRTRRLPRLRP